MLGFCKCGSTMELIVLPPAAPPSLPASAPWIWGLIWLWVGAVASGLSILLLLLLCTIRGAKGYLNCFAQDPIIHTDDQPKQMGMFQEEVDLATFVTRRPSTGGDTN